MNKFRYGGFDSRSLIEGWCDGSLVRFQVICDCLVQSNSGETNDAAGPRSLGPRRNPRPGGELMQTSKQMPLYSGKRRRAQSLEIE